MSKSDSDKPVADLTKRVMDDLANGHQSSYGLDRDEADALLRQLKSVFEPSSPVISDPITSLGAIRAYPPATTTTTTTTGDPAMPYKFKTGDLVKLSQDGKARYEHQAPNGMIGTILAQSNPYPVRWADNSTNTYVQEYLMAATTTPVAAPVTFESVILADEKKQQILDAIAQVDHHDLIFNQWGFADVFEKGTAISMLFYGQPGTGKTLMAQAIADKYKKKLVFVSTADIETPEPGGAERNIKEAFEKAQKAGDVILFDECDSLITDRARVGMILAAQINALLSELEKYTGIAVFTTNRLGALDPAFERRLSLKLEFPMPTAEQRVDIWKRMFPGKAPLAKDIDWVSLSQIEIAGGHIKNIVLKAARNAAAAGASEIDNEALFRALEQEVDSLTAFHDAVDAYNPFYGTPVRGGVGAGSTGVARTRVVERTLERRSKGKLEIDRG